MARRLPLRDAALLNGVLTHGLDYDDTHMAGVIHLSVSVLPAVLALAGQRGASGAEMLAAYIAALEAGARISSATKRRPARARLSPDRRGRRVRQRLAAGRLLGLSSRATGACAGRRAVDGERQPAVHRGRRLDQALASRLGGAGRRSPRRRSPRTASRRRRRRTKAATASIACYLGEAEHARIDLSLATAGSKPTVRRASGRVDNVAIKPFPMCHFVHASADAAIALQRHGVDAARIRSVEVRVPAGVVQAVCEPIANKRRPTSDYDAKFSLPYAVASGLLRGRSG